MSLIQVSIVMREKILRFNPNCKYPNDLFWKMYLLQMHKKKLVKMQKISPPNLQTTSLK
jgi:hypothetical protein